MATVKSPPWVPDRRDMIWIDYKPQVGGEMKAEHPMLVLSTKAFNERTGIVIGLPMTHAQSNETNPFAVRYVGPKNEVGYVLTHQPKSFDWHQCSARPHPWKQVTPARFQDVCDELNSIISICA
jgi:mRNA interferase MazF